MAASIVKWYPLGLTARKAISLRTAAVNQTWTRTFFRRKKDKEEAEVAVVKPDVDQLLASAAVKLRKREGLQTVRRYKPPADVEVRVHRIASEVCGQSQDLENYRFSDNSVKLEFFERLMSEFDHFIPNPDLPYIQSIGDAVSFFSTPVHDSTVYEDLSKLDLPPNLHIQLEPLRFDPETDTMYGGVSAFPGSTTIVSSLKYRRKYGKKTE